jgi:hypothetical protein
MLGTDVNVRPPEVAPGTIPPFDVSIRRIGGNAPHLVEVDKRWAEINRAYVLDS